MTHPIPISQLKHTEEAYGLVLQHLEARGVEPSLLYDAARRSRSTPVYVNQGILKDNPSIYGTAYFADTGPYASEAPDARFNFYVIFRDQVPTLAMVAHELCHVLLDTIAVLGGDAMLAPEHHELIWPLEQAILKRPKTLYESTNA